MFWFGGALDADVSVATLPAAQERWASPPPWKACSGVGSRHLRDARGAADYAVTDITVTFHNKRLFDAEWLTCSLVPGAGDVALCAQSDDQAGSSRPLRGAADVLALSNEGDGAGRALDVEYYVLGMRRTMTVPLDG